MKFRRTARGLHSFMQDGKRISVKFGQVIEANPKELGSHISGYEPASSKTNLEKSLLELETDRLIYICRKKSMWLTEQKSPDDQTYWKIPSKDLPGLQRVLEEKTDDGMETGKPGELPRAKSELRNAWSEWQLLCDQDPRKRLDPKLPQDNHLSNIAQCQATIIILESEIKEIQERIKAAMIPNEDMKKQEIKRKQYQGIYRTDKERNIIECDGREVRQDKNDKPIFVDNESSVLSYLEESKKRRIKQDLVRREKNKKLSKSAAA